MSQALLERQWRLQRYSSVLGYKDPEGQRDQLCCSTIQPHMADSAAHHCHQADQKKSPKPSDKIQIKWNETHICRKARDRDRANRADLNDMWRANMEKQGQAAGQTSQQHSQALHFTHTNKTDRRTGSSNRRPCRTVVSCGTQCWLRQACLVTQPASLTLHTWLCTSTLWGFI